MVSEGIKQPTDSHVHSQFFPIVSFAILDLADKVFASGHVVVGHDIHATHQLQSSFSHKLPEGTLLLRVSFKERPHVSHLVKDKAIVGILLKKIERFENVWQAHL